MDKGAFDISNIEGLAIDTAGAMLESAEAVIDTQFGTGYAERHPALVAGFVQACAMVYHAERAGGAQNELANEVEGIQLQISGAAGRHG